VASTDGNKPNPAQTRLQERQYEITVPSVRDRIVQVAVKIVLEPVFEADFLPCSFGFRPKRSRKPWSCRPLTVAVSPPQTTIFTATGSGNQATNQNVYRGRRR
jgi:hypothetical protein